MIIVVDDCSTDNSRAEVEKLTPHFDGRLKILSTEKNSGGAGVPRNIGIEHAAEEFQADVVHTEKFFTFDSTNLIL